jgi:hypothetical protein
VTWWSVVLVGTYVMTRWSAIGIWVELLSMICIGSLSTRLGRVEHAISLREVCSLVEMDYPTLA